MAFDLTPIQQPDSPRRFATKKYILSHSQLRDQIKFLRDSADASLLCLDRVGENYLFAGHANFSRCRLQKATDDINQCAFASPIFSHQRVNLSGQETEIDVV